MANIGVGWGIGEGIGEGLQSVAAGLTKRWDQQSADRDQKADALTKKGVDLFHNVAQAGYQVKKIANPYDTNAQYPDWLGKGYEVLDSSGKPVDPASVPPQVQNWISEGSKAAEEARNLFPPHETGALIQHFRKWLGKDQAPPQPNPRAAEFTPEGFQSQAPVPQNNILQDMNNFVTAAMQANPRMTREQAVSEWWHQMQVKGGTEARAGSEKPAWKQYRSSDGTVDWYDINDQSDIARIPKGATAVSAGNAPAKAGTLGAYITSKYPNGATPEQQTAAKAEWESKLPKVGSEEDFVKSEYGDSPTPEQKLEAHRLWTGQGADTVGTHVIEVPQPDGSIKAYQVTTTSHKDLPGAPAAPGPSTVKTPADAKAKIKEMGVTGGRETPAQTDADKKYGDAVKLNSLAQNALKNHSATNDKLLAGALIRGTEGRFNAAQYDNLTKKSGLGNTLYQWLESASTGQLTDEIRQQLVDAATANLNAAKAQQDASRAKPDNADTPKPPANTNDPLGILGKKP